jgi:hypothetical protein
LPFSITPCYQKVDLNYHLIKMIQVSASSFRSPASGINSRTGTLNPGKEAGDLCVSPMTMPSAG